MHIYRIIPNKRAGRGDEVGDAFIMCTKMQGSKLVVVRWPEATKYSAGPPEHWVAVVLQATKIFRPKIIKQIKNI